jgi:NADH dehydrogenase
MAVLAAFTGAGVIRPAVMFGPDDAFLNTVIKLLRRLPIYPMFGRGETRLQPVDVEDVAEAVARVIQRTEMGPLTLECGGPRMYSNEELLRTIARAASVKPFLLPVAICCLACFGLVAQVRPGAPVTRNQVELVQVDTRRIAESAGFCRTWDFAAADGSGP